MVGGHRHGDEQTPDEDEHDREGRTKTLHWLVILTRHIQYLPHRNRVVRTRRRREGLCGSGTLPAVPAAGTPVTATLPFIPTATAVMTAAELVKTTLQDYPRNVNFGCLDFLGNVGDFLTVPRERSAGCICEGQRDLWRHLNAATMFAGLSDE